MMSLVAWQEMDWTLWICQTDLRGLSLAAVMEAEACLLRQVKLL